ncbi:MAG: secretin N-terminal domain-containing protein [Pseudomonas sp.]
MSLRALLACLLFSLSLPLLAATEVITLKYRMADEVLPLVESVLGGAGRVSPYGNQLIVNADPAQIEELRRLLEQLDTPPARLLISVDTRQTRSQNEHSYGLNGSASSGKVEIQAGAGERHGSDSVRIIQRSTASRDGGTQQVQATEGYPALIQVGQSVPLTSHSSDGYGQAYSEIEYRNVTRGFYVTARLSGEQVHISISSHNDRLSATQSAVIDLNSTETQVSSRLGEWINLSSVSEQSLDHQRGTVQRHSTQGRDDLSLRVKVERLD